MPKLGMQPIRRLALVKATIDEIGTKGTLDVTVAQIARRAGMSSALAHHYLGGKEDMFLAAMRYTLALYGAEVRGALLMADSPLDRTRAVIRAGFSPTSFRPEVVAAWLNFWVLARTLPGARRLLVIYQGRLRSNLVSGLRPLVGARAPRIADALGAMIDGLYLRHGLRPAGPDGAEATAQVLAMLAHELEGA